MEGYRVPVFKAFTEKILMAGVPREVFYLNGTLAAVFLVGMHIWWLIPLNLIIHIAFVKVTKKDPYFFDIFKRYINRKDYYDV
ncbi:MAG: VirB3 family type IV secretion system protein [Bacillota bacterium]